MASAIEVSIQRSAEVGQLRFDLEVFHCPPRVPGKPVPYYAVSWTSLTDGKCGNVHTLALNGDDPVEMIWASLRRIGLGDLVASRQAFNDQVWITGHDEHQSPGAVRASAVSSSEWHRYRVALLLTDQTLVWVHRIDEDNQ